MATLRQDVDQIKEKMVHNQKEPITQYALICRAMNVVRYDSYTHHGVFDPVAEALDELLVELKL